MNGQLPHKDAFELLPWYVNGTLDPDEHRDVRAHLSHCLVCRRELGFLERLEREVVTSPDRDPALQRGLADVMLRIETAQAPLARRLWAAIATAVRSSHPLLCGALVVQTAALALVAFLLVRSPSPDDATFETLSDAPVLSVPAQGQVRLRVVFGPEMSVADLDALLRAAGARVVDGPSSVGAYAIEVPDDASAALLEDLRADTRVSFAEPAVVGDGL